MTWCFIWYYQDLVYYTCRLHGLIVTILVFLEWARVVASWMTNRPATTYQQVIPLTVLRYFWRTCQDISNSVLEKIVCVWCVRQWGGAAVVEGRRKSWNIELSSCRLGYWFICLSEFNITPTAWVTWVWFLDLKFAWHCTLTRVDEDKNVKELDFHSSSVKNIMTSILVY